MSRIRNTGFYTFYHRMFTNATIFCIKCSCVKNGPALWFFLVRGEGDVLCAGELEHGHVRVQAPGHVALAHRQAANLNIYTVLCRKYIFYTKDVYVALDLPNVSPVQDVHIGCECCSGSPVSMTTYRYLSNF